MASERKGTEFIKGLGVMDAANIVMGSMIGSGIFLAPSLMAGYIQTPGLLILLWLIGGLLTVFAALSFSELAASFPRAGGQYVFLKESFSPLWGFLYGWCVFLVIQTGFIAAVSIAFSKYLGVYLPFIGENRLLFRLPLGGLTMSLSTAQVAAILCIAVLTAVNIRGVRSGAMVQNVFTFLKIAAILVLIGAALLFGSGSWSHFRPLLQPRVPTAAGMTLFAALAVALSKALFAYDSWNSVTFVAEEIREPRKNLPRAMVLGAGGVTLIYCLTTMAYLYIVPIDRMAGLLENRIGAAVAEGVMGQAGLIFITAAILISTFGCVNGLILAGPRLYFAMGRDGLFFRRTADIHPRYKTPHAALVFQAVWSCVLVLTGSYNDLLTYTTFASLLFNALAVAGLFRLRRKSPDLPRPYRVPGYPFVPLVYILVACFFIVFIVVGDTKNSLKGLCIVAAGIPAFLIWRRRQAAAVSQGAEPGQG